MAYPTDSHAIRLTDIDRRMLAVKAHATGNVAKMAAGSVPSSVIFQVHATAKDHYEVLDAAKTYAAAHSEFLDYVRDQKENQTLDIAAEFTAVLAALFAVVTAIETAFPTYTSNGDDYLLAQVWGDNGPEDRMFTTTQTSGIRSKLTDLAATIG